MKLAPLLAALAIAAPALAGPPNDEAPAPLMPARVGQCVVSHVSGVFQRLVDGVTMKPIPNSGSAVSFTNGGYQVSYDAVPAVDASRAGDRVRICLVSIPHPCPPHDFRGRVYKTTNLRTGKSWLLPDAEHPCGGA